MITASEGHTELIPDKRSYKLKFIGFQDCENIVVKSGNSTVQYAKNYDINLNMLELTVEQAEVSKALLVQFEKLELCENKIEDRLLQFLDNAQIEFQLKEKIYYLFKRNSNTTKMISELHTMNLSQNLFGALCEILFAS